MMIEDEGRNYLERRGREMDAGATLGCQDLRGCAARGCTRLGVTC